MDHDIEAMPDEKVRKDLDKYVRLFDVSFTALLLVSDPNHPADKQKLAADAVALIERYPHDDRFACGGTALRDSREETTASD